MENKSKKTEYVKATAKIIRFVKEDIIATSVDPCTNNASSGCNSCGASR